MDAAGAVAAGVAGVVAGVLAGVAAGVAAAAGAVAWSSLSASCWSPGPTVPASARTCSCWSGRCAAVGRPTDGYAALQSVQPGLQGVERADQGSACFAAELES